MHVKPYGIMHFKYVFEEIRNKPPQNMPLWYKDHFKLKIVETQQMKENKRKTRSSKFWEIRLP